MVGCGSGNHKKDIAYPLRVGRKQKRAILDANSSEIVIFEKGHEALAKLTCELLNSKHVDGLPYILERFEQSSDRYIKAERFIVELAEMNFFQRAFSVSRIIKFLNRTL